MNRRVAITPPDIEESRNGNTLLVWGQAPHWMVVDGEMRKLFSRMDGTKRLSELVEEYQYSPGELIPLVRSLRRQGVLCDSPDSRPVPIGTLESIAINVTGRCNLRCIYCYARDDSIQKPRKEISPQEIRRFLQDTGRHAKKSCALVLLGGEPFMAEENLFAAAEEGMRLGMTPIVSTNGTMVTPESAARIQRIHMQVQVSLDGVSAKSHDRVRGRGSFEKAMSGVDVLLSAGAYVILSMVMHEENLNELEAFFDLARNKGVQEARFIPLKLIGAAAEAPLRPVAITRLMQSARELFRRRPEFLPLLGKDAFTILANTCRYSAKRNGCGTGDQTVLLDADGSLYPCLNLRTPEFRLASIRQEQYNFKRLWRRSETLRDLRKMTGLQNKERVCSRCPTRYWCLGGCRGETFSLYDDVSRPARDCGQLRKAVLEMMWLLAESPELVQPAVKIC